MAETSEEKETSLTAAWVWTLLSILGMVAFAGWVWGVNSPPYLFWILLAGSLALYIRGLMLAFGLVDDRAKTKDSLIILRLCMHLSFMGLVPVAGPVGVLVGLAIQRSARRLLIDSSRKGYGAPLVAILLVYIFAAQAVWLRYYLDFLRGLVS